MGYVYLAQPYTSHRETPEQRQNEMAQREFEGARYAHHLMQQDIVVFAPIVHGHAIAARFDLPRTFDWWWGQDKTMLDRAAVLHVLCLPGWRDSVGVRNEIEYAREHLYIAVRYICPVSYRMHQDPEGL